MSNIDKEVLVGFEAISAKDGGVGQVEQERTLTNAPLSDQGDALTVNQQRQDLASFGLAAKEIGSVSNRPTMEKRVLKRYDPRSFCGRRSIEVGLLYLFIS
jgi:hypothetical protein